tara:strand:- start:216 stop:416 length:201 start_codon:yes stop_codon:yes gene_type:complete
LIKKKGTSVFFYFLADQAPRLRIMNWLIATYQKGKKTIRVFAQVVMAPILKVNLIGEALKKMGGCW